MLQRLRARCIFENEHTVMASSAAMLGSTGGAMFVGADALMGDGTAAPEDSAMQEDASTSSTNNMLMGLLLVCMVLLLGIMVWWYYKKKRT